MKFFIWDVILFDSSFSIERPQRLYKQGMRMLTSGYEQTSESISKHVRHTSEKDKEKDREKDRSKDDYLSADQQAVIVADPNDMSAAEKHTKKKDHIIDTASHTFYINNSERRIKLVAKNERQMDQFIASISRISDRSIWIGKNRFNSFAPIRMRAQAQWLIDGVRSLTFCFVSYLECVLILLLFIF